MTMRTTPPDSILRMAILDDWNGDVWYGEGTVTPSGITGWQKWPAYECPWGGNDYFSVWWANDLSVASRRLGPDRHLIWLALKEDTDFWYIMYQKSADEGQTWSAPIALDATTAKWDIFGWLRIQGSDLGELWISYLFYPDVGPEGIRVWRSADNGTTWDQVATLPLGYESDLQIDNSGRVYNTGKDSVNFVEFWTWYSDDHGVSWVGPYTLTPVGEDDWVEYMKTELDDADTLHCMCKYHPIGGGPVAYNCPVHYNWNAMAGEGPHQIHDKKLAFFSFVPTFAFAGDDVYAFWFDDVGKEGGYLHNLWFSYSSDRGLNWSNQILLSEDSPNEWGIPETDQGSPACFVKDGIACYVCAATDKDMHDPPGFIAFITADKGGTWVQDFFQEWDSPWFHQAVASYFSARPSQTQYFLA